MLLVRKIQKFKSTLPQGLLGLVANGLFHILSSLAACIAFLSRKRWETQLHMDVVDSEWLGCLPSGNLTVHI